MKLWPSSSGVRVLLIVAGSVLAGVIVAGGLQLSGSDKTLYATVRRGNFPVTLAEAGSLKAAESLTYRSLLIGRETEITFLAPEGLQVRAGDVVVRLDDTEMTAELDRAIQAHRQSLIDQEMAKADLLDAQTAVTGLAEGEGALGLQEAQTAVRLAERKVDRLKQESDSMQPMLARGYITRDELDRAALQLEEAQAAADLAKKRVDVMTRTTRPRDQDKARVALAQRQMQHEQAQLRVREAEARVAGFREAIDSCTIVARRPGLVVYEEYLGSAPRRKIRVGDRVTPSQGLVTIPEVNRMLVVSSVRESDVHMIRTGQIAAVDVEAYPGQKLTGHVLSVGSLAHAQIERPWEDKRFDLIVEIDPNSVQLRPDMTARLDVHIDEARDALMVPVSAVFKRGASSVVHVVRRWNVDTVPVRSGRSNGTVVEIVSGVQDGDRVRLTDTVQ